MPKNCSQDSKLRVFGGVGGRERTIPSEKLGGVTSRQHACRASGCRASCHMQTRSPLDFARGEIMDGRVELVRSGLHLGEHPAGVHSCKKNRYLGPQPSTATVHLYHLHLQPYASFHSCMQTRPLSPRQMFSLEKARARSCERSMAGHIRAHTRAKAVT